MEKALEEMQQRRKNADAMNSLRLQEDEIQIALRRQKYREHMASAHEKEDKTQAVTKRQQN